MQTQLVTAGGEEGDLRGWGLDSLKTGWRLQNEKSDQPNAFHPLLPTPAELATLPHLQEPESLRLFQRVSAVAGHRTPQKNGGGADASRQIEQTPHPFLLQLRIPTLILPKASIHFKCTTLVFGQKCGLLGH